MDKRIEEIRARWNSDPRAATRQEMEDFAYLLGEVERLEGEVQGLKGEMAGVEMGASLGVGMIEDQLAAERKKYQRLVGVARIVAVLERNTALQAALAALQEEK